MCLCMPLAVNGVEPLHKGTQIITKGKGELLTVLAAQ